MGTGRLVLGLSAQRVDLDRPASELLPDRLQSYRLGVGWETALDSGWRVTGTLAPTMAGDRHLDSRSATLAGTVIGRLAGADERMWLLGLGVDPAGPIPVIPFFGAILRPAPKWTLRLVFPEFGVSRELGAAAGWKTEAKTTLRWSGGGYRVSPGFGTSRGRRELDGRWLRTQTLSAEAGLAATSGALRAELTTGWAFVRRFEYRDAGTRLDAKAAPTAGLSLSGRW